MERVFDHAWTRRGFREGVPCAPTFGVHLLTAYMINTFRRRNVTACAPRIASTYTPAIPSYFDGVDNIKNHVGKSWRRFEAPKARALIEHHIKGGRFDEPKAET